MQLVSDLVRIGFRLGACSVDPKSGQIERPDGTSRVAPKAMEVLLCLVRHPGELIEREELIRAGWGNDSGEHEEALTRCIAELRNALGDQHDHPEFIQTIPRRGYRLVAPVSTSAGKVPEVHPRDVPESRDLWEELKRRDVVRTSLAYAALAWLAIEVVAVLGDIFPIPIWTIQALVILAVIGFPVVVALSWAVQRTPEGLAIDMPVVSDAPPPSKISARKVDMIIIAALLLAIAFLLVPKPQLDSHSIAVLPFDNLSDYPADEGLGDGLTEELLSLLTQTEGLEVTARKATEYYRNKDLPLSDIVSDLGVSNIVEGSVQRFGETVRVTVQLIDGETLKHRWADSYDTDDVDLLQIRDTIAREIAAELRTVITDRGKRMMARDADIDRRVFMLYLRGRTELRKEHTPETLGAAEDRFREAVEIDADFARGWAGLCDTYLARFIQSGNEQAYYEQGELACQRAIALETDNAEVYIALGNLYRVSGELDAALLEFRNALTIAPEHYEAVYGTAQALDAQGDLGAAESAYYDLIRIEPGYWHGYNALGDFYYRNDRYGEAEVNFRRVTTLDPENALALNNLGAAQYMLGNYVGAAASWEDSVSLRPSNLVLSNVGLAAYYAGDYEKAAEMQRRALIEAPEDYRMWGRLGDAERQLGAIDEAFGAYDEAMKFASRAVELNPANAEALRYLSLFYSHTGDSAAAIRAIEKVRELQPEASSTNYYASKIYLNAGDIDRAYAELDEALAKGYSKEIAEADPDLATLMGPRTTRTRVVEQAS